MKKLLSVLLVAIMVISLASCFGGINEDAVGVYEMTAISGTVTANGVTTELGTDLYEYYTITLNKDGSAVVKAKGSQTSIEMEQEGTWKFEDGKVKLTSENQGVKVTEVMDWKDNVITYKTTQEGQGMKLDFELTLTKKG